MAAHVFLKLPSTITHWRGMHCQSSKTRETSRDSAFMDPQCRKEHKQLGDQHKYKYGLADGEKWHHIGDQMVMGSKDEALCK